MEMEDKPQIPVPRPSTLRWKILRRALLRSHQSDEKSEVIINRVSRKAKQGFNLIPCHLTETHPHLGPQDSDSRDLCFSYSLPTQTSQKLFLLSLAFRGDPFALLLVTRRSKRVIELGSGYGFAGLVIAAVSEASEVVISDGNPQVVDYIQQSIAANAGAFGDTIVTPKLLHWNQEEFMTLSHKFDIIVASDCTFFKEFHKGLVRTVKLLLKDSGASEAIFFSPKRGDSFDKFLEELKKSGLHFSVSENYDERVWKRHQELMKGDESWPNYEEDHCYPLLLKITRK